MKHEHVHPFPVHTFSADMAPAASTVFDRWALGRIQQSVPNARIRFRLWDGFELSSSAPVPPAATIVFKNRHALFSWVWDPDLNFGEAYMFGAVTILGDLVALLEEVYRALADSK